MTKKILSLLLCTLMIVSSLAIAPQIANAESDIVYSLATDTEIQGKDDDSTFEGSTWLQKCGDPTLTIVDNNGVNAISVTERGEDWHCIDLKNLTTLPDGFEYTIKVTGRTGQDAKMKLAQTGSPYTTFVSQVVGEDGVFSIEHTFTYAQLQDETMIRIQSENSIGDFDIDNIEIYKVIPPPVYDMATDDDIQGLDVDSTFEGSTWLQKCGDPTLTIVDNNGVNAIRVTERGEDWHCIDLKNLTTLPDGFEYTIKVTGRTGQDAKMKLAQTGSPYTTFVSQVVGEDGVFSIEHTFTYAQLQDETIIRIQSENSTGDFDIDNIVITKTPAESTPVPDGKALEEDINITFTDADKALWDGSISSVNTSNAAIEWVSDFGKDDDYSMKGTHLPDSTDYLGANNAIRLTFDEPLAKNAIYTISYSVYVPAEGNDGKDELTGPGIVLSGDYAGATGVTKFPSDFGTIDIESWKDVNVITPTDGLNETLKSIDFRFVVNDEPNHPDVWYIDNINISQELINISDTDPDYKEYTPLKDVYEDYFLIGTTSGNHRMTGDKLEIISYHFNAFTPENEMKPSSVQSTKGEFTYDSLDEQLGKVEGLNIIGHTLAWHSQSPSWMWGDPDPLSEEEAKANMDAHIENVMEKYGSELFAIDVVNEAFADGRDNDDWRLNLRDNEGWFKALGSDWVEYAFLKTAEIVDANGWDCKLYYNDYNLDDTAKATAVYNMVKDINERYEGTRPNGKQLIEGIGMQAHYNQNTVPANVESSINLFSTLPGISISITELDITYQNDGSLTERQAKRQGGKYAELFELYKKNAAGPANEGNGRIERVTFWGTNDADSWRGSSFPLLFDKNLRAKEAFKAVLDPEKYLSEVEPPQEIPVAKSVYGKPTLGTDNAAWDKAAVINVDTKPIEQSENAGATAVVKTLWDARYFYVRAEVTDSKLDKTSSNEWEQDSVEVFFSETAHRNAAYTDGDAQFRVNFEGLESFKSSSMADGFSSYAEVTDTGYIVEMKIPFKVIQPEHGANVSFDVQINDVTDGASTRLLTVWSDLDANGYNTTENWGSLILDQPVDGMHIYATSNGDGYSGANIILGNDADVWPWSTAGADGAVAFTPEENAAYRMTFSVTSTGAEALRIRWIKDDQNGNYTERDAATVNDNVYGDGEVATTIPAYFSGDNVLTNGQTKTFVAEFTLDGDEQPEGLIGNIAIRGGFGSNDFIINTLTIEKIIEDGDDVMLVDWPAQAPTTYIIYTAVADGTAKTANTTSVALEFEAPVPGLTADDITITAGTASAKKGTLSVVDGSNDTEYILNISGVTKEGTINLKITKDGVDDSVKVIDIHKKSSSGGGGGGGAPVQTPDTDPQSDFSDTPTGDEPPANIANKPVKGTVKDTPDEVLDSAKKAFEKNPDFVQASDPITLAAPVEENSGLTPVSVPVQEDIEFTALVSPNADGSFTPVPTYTDENGTVYALIDEEKTLIPVVIDTAFTDVSADNWFAEYAKIASELGIIIGYGDSRFGPDDTVTNQQTVTMFMRTIGFNASYDNVLENAAEKGIKYASVLENNDYTSRAATAVLIKDILAALDFDVSLTEDEKASLLGSFSDLEGLTEEATLSIAVAIKYGILEGTYIGEDHSTMEPATLLTRAQMATISTRIVEFLTSK